MGCLGIFVLTALGFLLLGPFGAIGGLLLAIAISVAPK